MTESDKAVMQQALDALRNHNGNYKLNRKECMAQEAVEDALIAAIAQPVQPADLERYLAVNYPDARGDDLTTRVIDALEQMDIALGMKEGAQPADETQALFAKLGQEMYNITTVVHSPNIPFEDQLACIPATWQNTADSLKVWLAHPANRTWSWDKVQDTYVMDPPEEPASVNMPITPSEKMCEAINGGYDNLSTFDKERLIGKAQLLYASLLKLAQPGICRGDSLQPEK